MRNIITASALAAALIAGPVAGQNADQMPAPPENAPAVNVGAAPMNTEKVSGDHRVRGGSHGDFFTLFGKIDTDGNGSLTESEISAGAGAIIETFDQNGDGAVSQEDMGQKHDKNKKPGMDERPGVDDADDGAASNETRAPDGAAETDGVEETLPSST